MKKILVDLDDVLSMDAFINMVNVFANEKYTYNDISDYYIESVLPEEKLNDFYQFFRNNNLYEYSNVAQNSKEVLMKLMLEYEIYICSSYYSELGNEIFPDMISKKCDFLMKNYPFLSSKNFIFCNDKSMIDADVRIDDRVDNLTGEGIKLLFTAYHNKDLTEKQLSELNIIRVDNWLDIEKILNK